MVKKWKYLGLDGTGGGKLIRKEAEQLPSSSVYARMQQAINSGLLVHNNSLGQAGRGEALHCIIRRNIYESRDAGCAYPSKGKARVAVCRDILMPIGLFVVKNKQSFFFHFSIECNFQVDARQACLDILG